MRNGNIRPPGLPDWILEALRVMKDAHSGLRNMETALRYAMELDDMDPRLRTEMQYVRDALGAVKISLSIMDMIADQVCRDIAQRDSSGRNRNTAKSSPEVLGGRDRNGHRGKRGRSIGDFPGHRPKVTRSAQDGATMDYNVSSNAIPNWFVETVRVTHHVYGGVRSIELELSQAVELDDVDSRLRNEMEHMLVALTTVKGSLALLDMTTGDVRKGITGNKAPGSKFSAEQ